MQKLCEEWLYDFLKSEGKEYRYVKQKAFKAGYTKSELKVARKFLGVVTICISGADGASKYWIWKLPDVVFKDGGKKY